NELLGGEPRARPTARQGVRDGGTRNRSGAEGDGSRGCPTVVVEQAPAAEHHRVPRLDAATLEEFTAATAADADASVVGQCAGLIIKTAARDREVSGRLDGDRSMIGDAPSGSAAEAAFLFGVGRGEIDGAARQVIDIVLDAT